MKSLIPLSIQDADAEDPAAIADELRDVGISLIVVGIGAGTNDTELSRIAGGPDNAFTAASFEELVGGEFVGQLTEKSCEVGEYLSVSL